MEASIVNRVLLIDEFDDRRDFVHRNMLKVERALYDQYKGISEYLKEQSDKEQRERLVEEWESKYANRTR